MRRLTGRADPTALAAGVTIVALGGLLLLDQTGALELDLGWVGAAWCAAAGVILLVSGITDDGDGR